MSKVKHFDLKIYLTNQNDEIFNLLKMIKPDWTKDNISSESLYGGFSCHIKRFYLINDSSNSLTFRVRNYFEDSSLNDHQFELRVIEKLSCRNLFPTLRATFKNGYVYDYVLAQPILTTAIKDQNFLDDSILKSIAEKLAEVHSTPIGELNTLPYFTKLRNLLEINFQVEVNDWPNKVQLLREINVVENHVKKLTSSSNFVLSHGDFHAFNIVKKSNGSIYFFDYEFAHVNHRAYDIAFFFQVLTFFGFSNEVHVNIPEYAEMEFVKNYLEFSDKNSTDANNLFSQVQTYKLVVLLFLIVLHSVYTNLAEKVSKNPHKCKEKLKLEYLHHKNKILARDFFEN